MDGFDSWKSDFIDDGKKKWGVGVCWDYMEDGECHDMCIYRHSPEAHPTVTVSCNENTGKTEVKMSKYVEIWVTRLRSLGCEYDRSRSTNVHTSLSVDEMIQTLRK